MGGTNEKSFCVSCSSGFDGEYLNAKKINQAVGSGCFEQSEGLFSARLAMTKKWD